VPFWPLLVSFAFLVALFLWILLAFEHQGKSNILKSADLGGVHDPVSSRIISKYNGEAGLDRSHGASSVIENPVNIHPRWALLSRDSSVKATTDVRGNLGPALVVNQNPPGNDWIKDRWQAASDMGGTAIPGQHWVQLEFRSSIHVTSIVLDWEAAFAEEYRLEGRVSLDNGEWCVLYDNSDEMHKSRRVVKESGQSPGVKRKMPLHVVHTISMDVERDCPIEILRLFIKKPFRVWGVSLWQFDVYGTYD